MSVYPVWALGNGGASEAERPSQSFKLAGPWPRIYVSGGDHEAADPAGTIERGSGLLSFSVSTLKTGTSISQGERVSYIMHHASPSASP